MAAGTNPELQNQVIYSVYLRNHTEEGSFLALVPDLDRIKALGTDIIWLMPIHPIGVKGKKGSLGCRDSFTASADDALDIVLMERQSQGRRSLGVFSLKARSGDVALELADGEYINLIDGSAVRVREGRLCCDGRPLIITVET